MDVELKDTIIDANTGADAIQRAPIVDYNTGRKCLRIGDISNQRKYNEWGYTEVNEENYKKYKLEKEDILIARTGSTIGINTFIEKDYKSVYNNGLIRLRIDKLKYNSKFIYYVIQTNKFKNYINGIAFGTTGQPNMKINDLLKFKFHYIPLEIQNKIVKILDNLDKKIELNNEINDNLLQIGVNLIDRDYINSEFVSIGKLSTVISKGTTPTKKDMLESNEDTAINFIKVTDFDSLGVNESKLEKIPNDIHKGKLKRSILKENDLLVSIAGTLGKSAVVTKKLNNSNTNQAVSFIRLKDNNDLGYLYFYTKSKYFQDKVNERKVHAVQPNLSLSELSNISVPIVQSQNRQKYNVMLNRILFNIEENRNLEHLRDILLPKLMDGEITLDKIEI